MFNSNTLWNRDGYEPEVWETDDDYSEDSKLDEELFRALLNRISGGKVVHGEVRA